MPYSDIAFCLLKTKIQSGRPFDCQVAKSYSMSPILVPDDTVTIKNIALEKLRKGDLIVFKINDCLCVHRYIHRLRNKDNLFRLITKGDNAPNFDPWTVTSENLFGKVTLVKKKNLEINFENFPWRINNFLLAFLSAIQAYLLKFRRRIKRFILPV